MSDRLEIKTTPDKPANYEVSVPGEEGHVAFTHRIEMFKYLNVKLESMDGESVQEVTDVLDEE